jgi:uncharacterized YccA/Bax inhibitor family protein
MAFRTKNPALNAKTFERVGQVGVAGETMTLEGTINKTGFLLFLLVAAAAWPWYNYFQSAGFYDTTPFLIGGALGGFAVALVCIFSPTTAPITAPLYAVLEGLFLGSLSARYETAFPNIVIQSVVLTFGTLAVMLVLYRTRIIQVTQKFATIVIAATGAIALLYVVNFALSMFTNTVIPFIHETGTFGIVFSLFVVGLAALNLALDFDFIEEGVGQGAPKVLEWYGAFGLLVTLVWLYLEILRLLSKLRRR